MTLRTLVLLALGICLWATAPSSAKPQAAAPKPASIARTPSAPRTIVPTKPAAAPKPLAAPRVASKPPVQINPPRGQNLALKPTPASNVKPPVTLGQPKPAPAGIVRPPVSLNQPKPAAPKPANIAKPAAPKPAAPKPANIAKPGANTVKPGQGKTPVVGSNANRSGTIGGNSMTANTGKTPGTAKPQTQKPASSDRIWGPRYGDYDKTPVKGGTNQQRQYTQALQNDLNASRAMLQTKKNELLRWNAQDQANFAAVFGTTDPAARRMILTRLDLALAMNVQLTPNNLVRAPQSEPGRYAYVYPNDPTRIYLDQRYFNARGTGADSRPGVLIHELSHFLGTRDYVYGRANVQNLARTSPSRALMNADSFEYYLEGVIPGRATLRTPPTRLP